MKKLLDALDNAASDDDGDTLDDNRSALTRLEGETTAGYWNKRSRMRDLTDALNDGDDDDGGDTAHEHHS